MTGLLPDNSRTVGAWMDNYCRAHPLEHIYQGADALAAVHVIGGNLRLQAWRLHVEDLMNKYLKALLTLSALSAIIIQSAIANDLGKYVGYGVAAKKVIVGYVDSDGMRGDSFQGCNFNRKIIFDDNTYLTCVGYGYQYAYRPDAILLVRGSSWKMIVGSDEYDMSNSL